MATRLRDWILAITILIVFAAAVACTPTRTGGVWPRPGGTGTAGENRGDPTAGGGGGGGEVGDQRQRQRQRQVRTTLDDGQRFGVHAPGNPKSAAASNTTMMRRMVHWDMLEPTKGNMRLADADKLVRSYHQAGIDLVLTLRCSNPKWGTVYEQGETSTRYKKKSAMPKNMDDWRRFVRTLVERYDGDGKSDMPNLIRPIRYWQFENEFAFQWQGSNDDLMQLMRITYETIKQADPKAVVISPGFYNVNIFALRDGFNERGWLYRGSRDEIRRRTTKADLPSRPPKDYRLAVDCLKRGTPYFDVIDLHIYARDLEEIEYIFAWMRDQFRANGINKPIWSLEFAAPFHDFTEERFNRYIVESQVVAFDLGMERIFWNSIIPVTPHENFRRLSLQTAQGQPKRAFHNYALTAQILAGFKSVTKLDSPPDTSLYRFDFKERGRAVWVAWKKDGSGGTSKSTRVTIPEGSGAVEVVGLVPPNKVTPAFRRSERFTDQGTLTLDVTEDPIFIVRKPGR